NSCVEVSIIEAPIEAAQTQPASEPDRPGAIHIYARRRCARRAGWRKFEAVLALTSGNQSVFGRQEQAPGCIRRNALPAHNALSNDAVGDPHGDCLECGAVAAREPCLRAYP